MEAYQITSTGQKVFEEEPTGPNQERIKEIILNSLNQKGYTFEWINDRNIPYEGNLSDANISINLAIYVWRISNEGKSRKNKEGKRIQISSSCDRTLLSRPFTENQKTLLLGIYERDEGFPIFAAWQVSNNRNAGASKSCFVKLDDFAQAIANGIYKGQDSSGNGVFTFTKDFLLDYIELAKEDGLELNQEELLTKETTKKKAVEKRVARAKRTLEQIQSVIGNITETDASAIVKQRIGQGAFRELLLHLHGSKCCLCDVTMPTLLTASHIKRWADSSNSDRLAAHNGLLLCPLHNALFDKFLISFQDDGHIIISNTLDAVHRTLFGLTPDITINVTEEMRPCLRWHRERLK